MAARMTGLPAQRVGLEQIEQMLQQAGVGALIDGRPDNQPVGRAQGLDHAPWTRRQLLAVDGYGQIIAGIDEVQELRRGEPAPLDHGQHAADKVAGP